MIAVGLAIAFLIADLIVLRAIKHARARAHFDEVMREQANFPKTPHKGLGRVAVHAMDLGRRDRVVN